MTAPTPDEAAVLRPEDYVWVRATVEEMRARVDYVAVPRDEWDAMTADQRDALVDSVAADAVANAGGYGAHVVDVSEVPDDEIEEALR
ncbi:hypothetical protein GCM10023403_10460 [Pseudonocardia benzenivorans]|uniref:DUF7167 family protein n=1 Tax=Pseudonocardia benzenivorans TaxID=228005 RepID=UPI0031F99CE3